jgi:NitT/TauT family transport system permease protein
MEAVAWIAAAPGGMPRRRWLSPRRLVVVLFLAMVGAVWQFSSSVMPPVLIPSPARVLARAGQLWSDPAFFSYLAVSIWHVAATIAIAFCVGTALALLAYFKPVLQPATYTRLAPFLNSFSSVGWAFLALIWFGITDGAVIFASSVALVPIALLNAGAGLRELNSEIVEMSVSFSRSPGRRTWLVILPMLFPYLFATLRLCFGIAWQIVLVVELLAGSGGLGTLISVARQRYWTDMVFAIAILVVVIVYAVDRLVFAVIQRRLRRSYAV